MGLCFSERFKTAFVFALAAGASSAAPPPSESPLQWDSPPTAAIQFCFSTSDLRIFERDGTQAQHFTGGVVEILRAPPREEHLVGLRILYFVDGNAQTIDRFSLRKGTAGSPILFERDPVAYVRNSVDQSPEWRPLDVRHFPLFIRWNTRKNGQSALLRRSNKMEPLLDEVQNLVDDVDSTDLICFNVSDAFDRFGVTPPLGPQTSPLMEAPSSL